MTTTNRVRAPVLLVLLIASVSAAVAAATVLLPRGAPEPDGPHSWHRELLSTTATLSLCGAPDNVFEQVGCSTASAADDLDSTQSVKNFKNACGNFIQCGGGAGELYSVDVEFYSGTSQYSQNDMYYALGSASIMRGSSNKITTCWKRDGESEDGCACLCEIVRKRTKLGSRPECHCVYNCAS